MPDLGIKYLKLGKMNKTIFAIFIIVIFYTLSLFVAPMTLESRRIEGLDGSANRIVYSEKWEDLSPYHRTIYTFSDLNCHQKHERSYSINENQMPVCARCLGMFVGGSVGLLFMSLNKGGYDLKDTLLDTLNLDLSMSEKKKLSMLIFIGAIFALPLILDGTIQLFADYESFNEFRTFTGLLFGFGFSVFISAMLLSAPIVEKYR